MREDFSKMLELLDAGPVEKVDSQKVTDVEQLPPRLAEVGLDIISDNRMTDLRELLGRPEGSTRRVYVCRHVLVRKVAEQQDLPGLRLQMLWDSPDLVINCENKMLDPHIVRHHLADDDQGPCEWAVKLNFASVPVGETVELIINLMQTIPPDDPQLSEKEWWRFEIVANPEIATSWILLPMDVPHADFNVLKSKPETPNVIELVKPTHRTSMYDGTVINWSVVHPDSEYVYSTRWSH